MLTDPAFIRRLDSLYLLARKVLGGSLQADRRSTRKGTGITFDRSNRQRRLLERPVSMPALVFFRPGIVDVVW